LLLRCRHDRGEVDHRAGEPVEFRYDKPVGLFPLKLFKGSTYAWAA
jgi:hypothetical protein